MARVNPISFLFQALLLCILLSSAPAAEPSQWLEIHSTHFTVITDAGEKKGKEVALRFEQMRAVFGVLLTKERLNQSVPLTILAFRNDKNYYQSAPLRQGQPINVPGFLVPGDDQDFIVLNLFEEEPWRAVAHDFAHMLLNYNYPAVPGWFDEGMAEYFSSIRLDDKKYEIGSDPELQSLYTEDLLQNQKEAHDLPKSLTELLGAQVWLAVPDLLTMKHDTSSFTEGTHHTLFYAQSWITVHYLIHEKKLPETGTYFDLVENQHVPVEDAVQRAYGMSVAQFDQAVKTYFHSLTPLFVALDASKQPGSQTNSKAPQVYQFPEVVGPGDSVITSKPLPEMDARATLAEVEIRIPDRREAGLRELKALAAAEPARDVTNREKEQEKKDQKIAVTVPGDEIAHRVLAWDDIQRSDFDGAAQELSDSASLSPRDTWIRYYLSVLKYRMAQSKHADMLGLPNMLQDLRAVLEWYPDFGAADDLLAVAHMEGGGPGAAMQYERAAIQRSPRNQEYVYHLAEIYIADKKWDAARVLLEQLESHGNPEVAAHARARLEQLPNEQKYGLSASGTPTEKFRPQSSPFDVLEEDAAKRAAAVAQAEKPATPGDQRAAKFVQGRLVGVDCSNPPVAILVVNAGDTVLKLRTADYKSLLLIGADKFSCDWNNRSVSVNYKPGGSSDGDLVSVEVR
jgi:hypothetical protein